MSKKPPSPEEIIGQAQAAALFFRTLVDEGVPPASAVSMACSYVGSLLITGRLNAEPKKPWEPES